ncbi:MAG: S1C family serine protease [Cellulosilyticaceae bacterium]
MSDSMNQDNQNFNANESENIRVGNPNEPMPPVIDVIPTHQNTYYHETIKNDKKSKSTGSLKKFVIGTLIVSIAGGASIGAGFGIVSPMAQSYFGNTGQKTNEKSVNDAYFNQVSVAPLSANSTIADIADRVGPSVVSIKNNRTVATWAGEFNESGLGSGVIFHEDDQKIYIISNAHVVDGASNLIVTFLGNTKVPATIIGSDSVTDIAVLAVEKTEIPPEQLAEIKPAVLGDSQNLRVGDLAVAIGNPVEEAFNNTVTVGVISALDREVQLTDKTMKLIQTDAAINPGNSGGALVGPNGEVIGINTIKLVDSQIEGMGFAIPINDVKPIVSELMEKGRISRPSLGIKGYDMTESLGIYDIPVGVMVVEVVPGSSAELAGLQPKDIILEFEGQKISTMEELKGLLIKKQVGDTISLKLVRGNVKHTVQVKLQEMPSATTTQG